MYYDYNCTVNFYSILVSMKNLVHSVAALLTFGSFPELSNAFLLSATNVSGKTSRSSGVTFLHAEATETAAGKGFGKVEEKKVHVQRDPMDMRPEEVKQLLLDLLPRMTGTSEEFKLIEQYVNALEDKFVAPQTLDFLNIAIAGEWQFLFTTNQLGRPSPLLRLTELLQRIEVKGLKGSLVNQAQWDLVDDGPTFDVNGKFSSTVSYNINQGARMTLEDDHDLSISLGKGSKVPSETESLVGLIYRAMPTEMFDASNLAMDTTYVDTEIRIVRFTGSRHEGVRNIFMRKGAIDIDPGF